MCIAFIAVKAHLRYPLIVLANRDEYLARPTMPMHRWEGQPTIVAGRDLRSGGTWFGVNDHARMALLTNYFEWREESSGKPQDPPSRGDLIPLFLGQNPPPNFADYLRENGPKFEGFNLIYGPFDELRHYNNRSGEITSLTRGIHGLSNAFLDTPWPKVERGKRLLEMALRKPVLELNDLWQILDDSTRADDADLPQTRLSLDVERQVSSIRILPRNGYGSRLATVMLVNQERQIQVWEKPYDGGPLVHQKLERPTDED